MDWSDEQIISNYKGVVEDSLKLNLGELEIKYTEFKSKFSKLYQMALENQDPNKLEMMLTARRSINNGKMTKMDAEMHVGNQLGKEFIYPKVEKPSQEDYNRAVRKIRKGKAIKELKDNVSK